MSHLPGITRRNLFFAAAATAADPIAADPPVRLPRKVRVAMAGLEGTHATEITNPLPRLPDVEVVALSDPDPKLRERFAAKPGLGQARQYDDYRAMLAKEEVDLVAINNSNGERAAAILACAARGLHVIAEKPLALTRAELDKVKRAMAAKKLALGTLLPMRFSPPYLALRRIVADGLIGEVLQMSAQKSYQQGARAAWFLKHGSYGGTIPWIGIHMIDLMRWTSGRELRQASGFQARIGVPGLGEMETVTASSFKLDNGGVATLHMDFLRPEKAGSHGDDRLRLAGTKGVAEYQAATGVTLMTADQALTKIEALPKAQSVFIDFLEATYNGKPSALPLADIYRVNEIAIAAEKAAAEGKVISV
jgi:predicted dehydrogenase